MSLDSLTPDKYQNIILDLTAERNIVVKGVAGSGKSLTLLKKAKQVSTYSQSYAIIVYTKSLKQFFVNELAEIGQTQGHVYYFEEWKRSTKPNFDYMFVDECQDFNAEEIGDFRSHGKFCWFFGDTNQSIMDFKPTKQNPNRHTVQSVEDTAKQIGVHPQDLCMNHRLTIENAKVGEYIRPNSHLSHACYKHGPKPYQINNENQLDDIINIINNGSLTKSGIIVYYEWQIIAVRDYFAKKGLAVEWKTKDIMNMDFNSNNPKLITMHCSKGLQFPEVFIPYAESYNTQDEKSALYVAVTRPLEQLYIMFRGNPCPFLPPATSEIYGNAQTINGPF